MVCIRLYTEYSDICFLDIQQEYIRGCECPVVESSFERMAQLSGFTFVFKLVVKKFQHCHGDGKLISSNKLIVYIIRLRVRVYRFGFVELSFRLHFVCVKKRFVL